MIPQPIRTVGHSTRTLSDLIGILSAHGIRLLVDVRTFPRSRRHPHFNRERMAETLPDVGIGYVHLPALGGLRKPLPGSPNGGWRTPGFQGFADYMRTPEFDAGLEQLRELGAQEVTAILCAEAVPWRCHRSLIADALTVRGVPVDHLFDESRSERHVVTPWAKVEGSRITYPPAQLDLTERASE